MVQINLKTMFKLWYQLNVMEQRVDKPSNKIQSLDN